MGEWGDKMGRHVYVGGAVGVASSLLFPPADSSCCFPEPKPPHGARAALQMSPAQPRRAEPHEPCSPLPPSGATSSRLPLARSPPLRPRSPAEGFGAPPSRLRVNFPAKGHLGKLAARRLASVPARLVIQQSYGFCTWEGRARNHKRS